MTNEIISNLMAISESIDDYSTAILCMVVLFGSLCAFIGAMVWKKLWEIQKEGD